MNNTRYEKTIILFLFQLLLVLLPCGICCAQRITDSGYRSIGFIKSDGTVQDSCNRTIGHADGVPMATAGYST